MITASGIALIEVASRRPAGCTGTPAAGACEIRVDDHGARGDGRTDDTRAIRAAVSALRDGGTLRFSAGRTYVTSATVQITGKADISVIATGASIVCTASGDASAVVRIENCRDVHVVGGFLRHAHHGVRRHDADGLNLNHCSDVLIERVHVGYVYSIGIRASGSRRVRITGCRVNGSVADGIGVYGGQRQPSIADGAIAAGSRTLRSSRSHFRVQDIGSTVTVSGAGAGGGDLVTTIVSRESRSRATLAAPARTTVERQFVKLQRPSTDVAITRNTVLNTGDDAISSVGYLTYSAPNTRIRIESNTITGSRARGILLTGTAHATVSSNTLRRIAMGGVFLVVEVGGVTTWGCRDVAIDKNSITTVGTAYPAANYPGIGVSSITTEYPIRDVTITRNVIHDAYSYYIGIGGWSGTEKPGSTRDVMVRGNRCLGGNHNNPAIQVIATTNVSVLQNRIERAHASAVTVTPQVAGHVVVRGNVIAAYDKGRSGYQALDVPTATALVADNVVDGTRITTGTTLRQHG